MKNSLFLILILLVAGCSSSQIARSPSATAESESSRRLSAIDSILQFYEHSSLEFHQNVRKAVSCVSEQNAEDSDAMKQIMNTNENKTALGEKMQLIAVPNSELKLNKKQIEEEFKNRVSRLIHDFFQIQIRKASTKPYTAIACYMSGFHDH